MKSIADSSVTIQTSSHSVPATPCWFGEVTPIAHYLRHQGVFALIEERVRFVRRRFGHYDLIDFVAVLLGYAISGERTLEAFYERVQPFANAFMALFERDQLPHRSTLSRFLAALDEPIVEALRTLFLEDLVARPLEKEEQPGGLWDRQGTHSLVFDVDGTRQAARVSRLAMHPGPSARAASVARGLCSWLSRTQARRDREDAHHRVTNAHSSMGGDVLRGIWGRQRRLSRRAAAGSFGDQYVCESPVGSTEPGCGAPGWAIWEWSSCRRSGWAGLHQARERLRSPRPAPGAGSPDPARLSRRPRIPKPEPVAPSLIARICF